MSVMCWRVRELSGVSGPRPEVDRTASSWVFDPEPFGSELKAELLRPKGSAEQQVNANKVEAKMGEYMSNRV
jgi:hypothetical protein